MRRSGLPGSPAARSRLAIANPGQPIADLVQSNKLFRWTPLLDKLLTGHPHVALVVHSSWRFLANDETLRDLLGLLGTRCKGSAPPGQRYEAIKWLLDDR